MDMGIVRGLFTLVLFVAFVCLVITVYSASRADEFDRASRLPLEEDAIPGPQQAPR
jgi:cbb3-type cytochrome oxidase subunit 3